MLQVLLNSFRQQYPKEGVASLFCARGKSPISPKIWALPGLEHLSLCLVILSGKHVQDNYRTTTGQPTGQPTGQLIWLEASGNSPAS